MAEKSSNIHLIHDGFFEAIKR